MRMWMLLALAACGPKRPPVEAPPVPTGRCAPAPDTRSFAILHLNDIYRTEGLLNGDGGLARVRTLRAQLERECPDGVLLTHAGDALFPSLVSRLFLGEQMIAGLNRLDGDAVARDPLMFATFGNHEFDKRKAVEAPVLAERVAQSQFTWLGTNIDFGDPPTVGPDNVADLAVVTVQGVRVGLFSLTIANEVPAYASIDGDFEKLAREWTAKLRAEPHDAEVVIALTHLDRSTDVALLEALGADGPDLVLGGHNHVKSTDEVDGRFVLKGDADAVTVRAIAVQVGPDGVKVIPDGEGTVLTPDTMPGDPLVAESVQEHLAAHSAAFCGSKALDCLQEAYTPANTTLIGEELEIRRYETNLGDWVTDRALETYAEQGAQIAFVNSGGLRLNQNVPEGVSITRQVMEELFQYPTDLHLFEITGAELQEVVGRSVEEWSGNGHWLQIAGFAFRHDTEKGTASQLTLLTEEGPRPIAPDETLKAVTNGYLLGGGDRYGMLADNPRLSDEDAAPDLKNLVIEALKAAGDTGIAPEVEGRICSSDREGPCLAVEP